MDALSDVLNSVRLEGAVYLNAEFTAPWCIRGELGLASVRERLAGSEHVAFFHFLTEGRCKVRLADGGEVFEAAAGDLILFPQEGRHLMGTDLQLAPIGGSPPRDALLQTAVCTCLVVTVGSFFAVQPLIDLCKHAVNALPF